MLCSTLTRNNKGKAGEQLVNELYAVLNRGFSGKAGILSNSTEGNLGDKERLGTMNTPSGNTEIFSNGSNRRAARQYGSSPQKRWQRFQVFTRNWMMIP